MIDTSRPIDYDQLYAQAMHELAHGERYWFNDADEYVMTEANREFQQYSPEEQFLSVISAWRKRGKRRVDGACRNIEDIASGSGYSIERQEGGGIRTNFEETGYSFTAYT